ncbi:MAG: MBL fold metallo-hydrolase [Chloroflexi bacterium AL-W]|nr:MBL fold metallo-hydrolase [Chloroflexi bacterium AL-N1]NOK71368.1 MBL fold metallo-hydrolase [Chloroflexi bacterium AL-N10]NOK78771.1 MBL fold metallo-hydrolase [Chloroflexi bacterium AL-N5]NOK86141.1 MBL fold metallo-hydrolase [Chloroflexi bacterium AL-W]NOK93094.1 MBL fold metallo-hydrolase [Chloroflexi bacterium AL-N15]
MALLQQITERTFFVPGANNLGIITTNDGGAIAVDTGLDKDTGRLVRKALDEANLTLQAIISTHHHADHVGGNDYLLRNMPDVVVYAPRVEASLIEHPLLEPIYLNMGAQPLAALHNKWLMAKGSPVHHLIDDKQIEVAGVWFDILALPGHSINQIGVAFDGVCFVADGFFGPAILEKHGIPYAHDVHAQLTSFDSILQRGEHCFLPGHGDLLERDSLAHVIAVNRSAVERSSQMVYAALGESGDLFAVARRVQQAMELRLAGIPHFAIFVSAVAAHLTYLEVEGLVHIVFDERGMIWQRAV